MRKYFGTDGIRRIANTELSPELVYRVAKAGAYVLSKHSTKTPTILIGRDTRISGTLIESAMVAGFLSYGANVKLLGVIPTPGVAYLTRKLQADASVVISASHNTFEFNGIKYFSNKGTKIPDEIEEEIEEVMDSGKLDELSAVSEKIGVSEVRTDLLDEYVYFFRKNFDDNIEKLNRPDFKVVIDTANGATYKVADKVFKTLGINHVIINNNPNGVNINDGCGSTHLEMLKEYVVKNKMSLGIAYDGDGDRCLAVDENGDEIDGDKLLAIISNYLKPNGKFVFVEFHPIVWMFDDDFKRIEYNYFNSGAIRETQEGTYTDGENDLLQECVTWNHSLREVINSLIQSGLTISSFDEFDYSPYNCFSQTVECEPNKYRIKHLSNHIPMVYSIIATK